MKIRCYERSSGLEEGAEEDTPQRRLGGEEMGEEIEVPCVICCETVKILSKMKMRRKEEDKRDFTWFLRCFMNPPGQDLYETKVKFLKGEVQGVWDGK